MGLLSAPIDTAQSALAADSRSLEALKAQAAKDPQAALKGTATQFEAVFVAMLMKSMRETVPQDGPFASDATRAYTSMLDSQLAQKLSGRGLGLADLIVKQLQRRVPGATGPAAGAANAADAPQAFVDKFRDAAAAAGRATGVPARFILGQAALESGWGRHEIRGTDGTASHNLFGIKAGPGWRGAAVDAATTEYVAGAPVTTVAKFRAYGSYEEGFRDWAQLMQSDPRYARVLAQTADPAAYAGGMQAAGYATDPRYADKLTQVLSHRLLQSG